VKHWKLILICDVFILVNHTGIMLTCKNVRAAVSVLKLMKIHLVNMTL